MKKVRIEYEGKTYTLCYTLASIAKMDFAGARDNSLGAYYNLLKGAFAEYHPDVTDEELTGIMASLENSQGFMETLMKMFEETVEALTGSGEKDGAEKNARWAVV